MDEVRKVDFTQYCNECGDCDGHHFRLCSKYQPVDWWDRGQVSA